MDPAFDPSPAFESDACVLVVGDAPELVATLVPGTAIVRHGAFDLADIAATARDDVAVAVIDARSLPEPIVARVRELPELANVPVMMLTSRDDAGSSPPSADDVVPCPIAAHELAQRLHALVALGQFRARSSPKSGVPASFRRLRESASESPPLNAALAEVDRLYGMLVDRQMFDHAILDGVDVGIVTTDGAGNVTFLNRTARGLLGVHDRSAPRDLRTLLGLTSSLDELLGDETRVRVVHTLRRQGGLLDDGDDDEAEDLEVELSVSRAEGSAHDLVGFFVIFRDLTQEKRLEAEHRRFERLAAMGTMVAGFAHEVRNPVASLRSLAESLGEELSEANLHFPHIGHMLRVLDRVERLVRTSLQFGRPATPRLSANRPWALLTAAATALHPRTRELGGELRVEVEPELPDVFVDEGQLIQVLVILLNNALDATQSPRRVLLRAVGARSVEFEGRSRKSQPPPLPPSGAGRPRGVRLEVTDDGPGIPPEIVSRIFDPFFTTRPSGTGLGLSIAQQLVSENRGRLVLASSSGGNTTFAVLLGETSEPS